ncbi:hypothetical protein BJ138DRAFT_1230024 [Hygrophoropsis aurantiaca]|uniref:Uncharacterized protein n=1 Tax=Hygrophoropsis aurantiaca TaxID=72124 RepID=A0ACB7ZXH9_9AGAM|nr:hypothetical protein BJ138DRAFT_1230024 [Hygrophoropsis aurantiaca]
MTRGRPSKRPKLSRYMPRQSESEPPRNHHRHRAFQLHEDGKISLQTSFIPSTQPVLSQPTELNVDGNQVDGWNEAPFFDDPPEPEIIQIQEEQVKRKRTAGDYPLLAWILERQNFLDEFIRLEGRGGHTEESCQCGQEGARYRCKDCYGIELFCQACTVQRHSVNPFHRVEEWTGRFFQRQTLKSLGLRIQLNHSPADKCYHKQPANGDDFVVIDVHGIHEIGLDFCGCPGAPVRWKQLIRARLFGATVTDPRSAATFAVVEHFQLLSLESKVSAYEFYHSVARRTDNTGLSPIRDRYSPFLRVVREWRHLKMLKRSGRGHDPNGVEATVAGECAVLCPACPHPGKNLPEGWADAPEDTRWTYALFLAIDANFRLKRKKVSNDTVDPSLSVGWGCFVEESIYKDYLRDRIDLPQETSTCSGHRAVNLADTKSSIGLAATGVGTVDCARHDMKLPNGVGDLQKGEKYVNMDYLVFNVLRAFKVKSLNLSYDIACQWHKNLWPRMNSMPQELHIDRENMFIKYFVPKFHLKAHIAPCQTRFSFNWTKGVGRTDGEAPERGWSNVNRVASSTKEMGPGSRRDCLDEHFNDWNWKKVISLGRTLLARMKEAVKAKNEHQAMLEDFEASLRNKGHIFSLWIAEIEAWEDDNTKRNPFQSRVVVMTEAAVRLKLAQDEAKEQQAGICMSLHAEVSPSILIAAGIDLEDNQRRLRADSAALGAHATDIQKTKIYTRRNALQRKIDAWARIQELYMPIVSALRAREDAAASNNAAEERTGPEDTKLFLPSTITPQSTCDLKLREIEWELRFAQAQDALHEIRSHLRLTSYMLRVKDSQLRGQGPMTRARTQLQSVDNRKQASFLKYQAARAALVNLSTSIDKIGWDRTIRPLLKEDMRAMGDLLDDETEGTRAMPWIWRSAGVSEDDSAGVQDCLRVEWCKARARAARWTEEVQLLSEEMRRTLEFLNWQANWWDERARSRIALLSGETECEGMIAYANRQTTLRHSLITKFQTLWHDVPAMVASGPSVDVDAVSPDVDESPSVEAPPLED